MSHNHPSPASPEAMRVLTRGDVRACLTQVDAVAVVEDALVQHATGHSVLPPEAYLRWENSRSAYCRSLAMPGALGADPDRVIGLKVINAAVSNPEAGLPRAGGFTTLFDAETGRPRILAEGALISALRTAAYTMASLRHIGPAAFSTVAMIGCGNLASVHAELLKRYFPEARRLSLYDVRPQMAAEVARDWADDGDRVAVVHDNVRAAVGGADVVVTLTTSNDPYIERSWLSDSAFLAHVSLGDLKAEVFTEASAIYVDDLALVQDNPRRVLGALLRDRLVSPYPDDSGAPFIAGTLGDVIRGSVARPGPDAAMVVSNPFGMSILDLALLRDVARIAEKDDRGVYLDLTTEAPAAGIGIGEN